MEKCHSKHAAVITPHVLPAGHLLDGEVLPERSHNEEEEDIHAQQGKIPHWSSPLKGGQGEAHHHEDFAEEAVDCPVVAVNGEAKEYFLLLGGDDRVVHLLLLCGKDLFLSQQGGVGLGLVHLVEHEHEGDFQLG